MNTEYSLQFFQTGPISVNTYILMYNKKAAIIDPGGNFKRIMLELNNLDCELTHIFLTHGHFDHIGAVAQLKEATGATVYIHKEDADMTSDPRLNLSQGMGSLTVSCKVDVKLSDGDVIDFGKGIKFIHTPGHTRGGGCYDTGEMLFTGDTILEYDIGRTDFPGGSYSQIVNSIKNKIYALSGERVVYPGHGASTYLSDEKQMNHFVTAD